MCPKKNIYSIEDNIMFPTMHILESTTGARNPFSPRPSQLPSSKFQKEMYDNIKAHNIYNHLTYSLNEYCCDNNLELIIKKAYHHLTVSGLQMGVYMSSKTEHCILCVNTEQYPLLYSMIHLLTQDEIVYYSYRMPDIRGHNDIGIQQLKEWKNAIIMTLNSIISDQQKKRVEDELRKYSIIASQEVVQQVMDSADDGFKRY